MQPLTPERKAEILANYLTTRNRMETKRQLNVSTKTIDAILKENNITPFFNMNQYGNVQYKENTVLNYDGQITTQNVFDFCGITEPGMDHPRRFVRAFLNTMKKKGLLSSVGRGVYEKVFQETEFYNEAKHILF